MINPRQIPGARDKWPRSPICGLPTRDTDGGKDGGPIVITEDGRRPFLGGGANLGREEQREGVSRNCETRHLPVPTRSRIYGHDDDGNKDGEKSPFASRAHGQIWPMSGSKESRISVRRVRFTDFRNRRPQKLAPSVSGPRTPWVSAVEKNRKFVGARMIRGEQPVANGW